MTNFIPCLSGWEIEKLPFFDAAVFDAADLAAPDLAAVALAAVDFAAADLAAADFDMGGFSSPELAEGGVTRMSARLQKQTGTLDLNIVLN